MPYIAAVLGGLFGGLVQWLAKYVTRRVAIVAAVIVLLFGMITAFFAAINAAVASISVLTPPGFNQAMSMVMPDNVPGLISILISARILRWVYEWNVKIIQWRLF